MFPVRKINDIKNVTIDPPLALSQQQLKKAIHEIKQSFHSGIFFGLNIDIELILPEQSEVNCYLLKFFWSPAKDQQSTSCAEAFLEIYDMKFSEDFHILLRVNSSKNICEFATDLEPEIFRKLLLLAPTLNKSLAKALTYSNYWLADPNNFYECYQECLAVL